MWVGVGCLGGKKNEKLYNSIAMENPRSVIIRAVSLMYSGIVMMGKFIGGVEIKKRKPAIRLPRANRKIGLINLGLFSLMGEIGGNRGFDISTKKIIRVL